MNIIENIYLNEGRGGELKCYIHIYRHTDRQTYRQTYRPSDEVGCRGAFAFGRRGVKMLHTYIQTDRQTYRPSDEVGCRGAFVPKNIGK